MACAPTVAYNTHVFKLCSFQRWKSSKPWDPDATQFDRDSLSESDDNLTCLLSLHPISSLKQPPHRPVQMLCIRFQTRDCKAKLGGTARTKHRVGARKNRRGWNIVRTKVPELHPEMKQRIAHLEDEVKTLMQHYSGTVGYEDLREIMTKMSDIPHVSVAALQFVLDTAASGEEDSSAENTSYATRRFTQVNAEAALSLWWSRGWLQPIPGSLSH